MDSISAAREISLEQRELVQMVIHCWGIILLQ